MKRIINNEQIQWQRIGDRRMYKSGGDYFFEGDANSFGYYIDWDIN